MTFAYSKWHMWLLFSLALTIRLVFASPFLLDNDFSPKSVAFDGYYEISQNLLKHGEFSRSTTEPLISDSVRTPLYPLIITAIISVTGNYKFLILLQVFIGSLIPLLGILIAKKMTQSETMPVIIGLLLAIEPTGALFTTLILTETFFIFFFLLGIYYLFKFFEDKSYSIIILSSILFGIATLIKPTIQYLPLLIVPLILWYQKENLWNAGKKASVFTIIFLLLLCPWAYRNYTIFNNSSLAVQQYSNSFSYLVPSIISLENGTNFRDEQNAIYNKYGLTDIDDINLRNGSIYKSYALNELLEHPKGLFFSLAITTYTFFLHDGLRSIYETYLITPEGGFGGSGLSKIIHDPLALTSLIKSPLIVSILLARLLWGIITLLMLVGIVRSLFRSTIKPPIVIAITLIAYFLVTSSIIGLAINYRFRNPINIFIFYFAVLGLMEIYTVIKNRKFIS